MTEVGDVHNRAAVVVYVAVIATPIRQPLATMPALFRQVSELRESTGAVFRDQQVIPE